MKKTEKNEKNEKNEEKYEKKEKRLYESKKYKSRKNLQFKLLIRSCFVSSFKLKAFKYAR